jgi:carotenoid cleavage dioxygenase
VTFDMELAASGSQLPYAWRADKGARVGVLPLLGAPDDITWCEAPQSYVYHPLNAVDLPDGRIAVDVVKWPKTFDDDDRQGPGRLATTLVRWTLDPARGTVAEELLSDRSQEFPRVPDALVGRQHRFGYGLGWLVGDPTGSVLKHDLDKGTTEAWDPGAGCVPGEAVFVPAEGAVAEDDGWLLTYVYDAATDSSDLVVLAAQDVAAGPVARVHLPQRVPVGFHGNWVPSP